MPELISRKTRDAFLEFFVGETVAEIAKRFRQADIEEDPDASVPPYVYGQRRGLAERHCATLDLSTPAGAAKLLHVYEGVLDDLDLWIEQNEGAARQQLQREQNNLKRLLERDGFVYSDGSLRSSVAGSALAQLARVAAPLDAPGIRRQIDLMQSTCETDPALAIGTAKELIETVCKTILGERGVDVDTNWSVIQLVKETRESLEVMPENIRGDAKGEKTIKSVLGSLGAIAHGIAELRNDYGTGHGRHGRHAGLQPRHARLAVLSTAALVTFLLDTHQRKQPG